MVLDQTGAITAGRPALTDVRPVAGFGEATLLRLATAAEADSGHQSAAAIVSGARHVAWRSAVPDHRRDGTQFPVGGR